MTTLKKTRFIASIAIAVACIVLVGAGKAVRLASDVMPARDISSGQLNGETLSLVGFSASDDKPDDAAIRTMVDEVVFQTLGSRGWGALCKKGDHVTIKVNMVGPHRGAAGEKGKAIITDPRIVKIVAEEIRAIIGSEGDSSIIVTDALFYDGENPSVESEGTSFRHSRYDDDGDGILDGGSLARLVNCDAYGKDRRYLTVVSEPILGKTEIWFPEFLRTRKEAGGKGEFTDVLVYLPIFKSHGFVGITGALKLPYGFRTNSGWKGDSGRTNHSGYGWGSGNKDLLIDYLCAENRARKCDFVILDAITANRKGPLNGSEVNIGKKTDYIETNAILASTDPVAIDTVETLLAGYDIESVKLLGAASRDGLGESRPSRIMVAGFERFGEHRAAISREYAPRKKTGKKEGTWPLEDGIGGARIRIDIEPPAIVRAEATRMQQDLWRVAYEANDDRSGKSSLARIDVLLHGARIASIFDCTESGCVEVQIPSADGAPNPLELVVWDAALNASRSPIETRSPNPTESGR